VSALVLKMYSLVLGIWLSIAMVADVTLTILAGLPQRPPTPGASSLRRVDGYVPELRYGQWKRLQPHNL
jgi:hypothetical protein